GHRERGRPRLQPPARPGRARLPDPARGQRGHDLLRRLRRELLVRGGGGGRGARGAPAPSGVLRGAGVRVAVVGYGKMGHEVESVLVERGHDPVILRQGAAFPVACPVGVDFTRAESVLANAEAALQAGGRYVIGTTGWDARMDDLRALVAATQGGVVHAANF